MKKTTRIAALLAAAALIFGSLFFSCSDDPEETTGGNGGGTEQNGGGEEATPVDYSIADFGDAIVAANILAEKPASGTANFPAQSGTAVAIADAKIIVMSNGEGNLRLRSDGTINYNGDSKRYVAIDTSKFGVSSGKLTVSFAIKVNASSGKSDTGIAFLSASAEDCPQNSNAFTVPSTALATENELKLGTGNDTRTLSATVAAGTKVYLFFSRNGAGGGGIDVTSISVTSAQ